MPVRRSAGLKKADRRNKYSHWYSRKEPSYDARRRGYNWGDTHIGVEGRNATREIGTSVRAGGGAGGRDYSDVDIKP